MQMAKTEIKKRLIAFCAALTFAVSVLYAQTEVVVKASLDSSRIFIGNQVNLNLEVSQPYGVTVKFPTYKDTLTKEIEVIEQGKIDTVLKENGRIELIQKIRITSFDSGLHYIPPVQLEVWSKINKNVVKSNELGLNVFNPFKVVDPKKGFFDIKPVLNTPFIFKELLGYIIWGLIIYAIIVVIAVSVFLFIRYRSKNGGVPYIFKTDQPKLPPYLIALNELERIKQEKMWMQGNEKAYYTKVTEVIRTYLEDQYMVSAMESTSDELLKLIKTSNLLDKSNTETLREILTQADLVKFAKYLPSPGENESILTKSVLFVTNTKPATTETSTINTETTTVKS